MTKRSETEQRERMVLAAFLRWSRMATYVVRNVVAGSEGSLGAQWPRAKTSAVLRILRRLERRGLVKQAPGPYAVMITWKITDEGRKMALSAGITEA